MLIATHCKSCESPLISIKLFNRFEIDKNTFYGLTCGVCVTFSTYLIYKLWKFNRNLNKSIDSINILTKRFECLIVDLAHLDESKIGYTERILNKQPVKKLTYEEDRKKLTIPSTSHKLKKSITSSSSISSSSEYYETPLTSPQQSSSDDSADDEDDEQFKDPIELNGDLNIGQQIQQSKQLFPLKSALKQRKIEDSLHVLMHKPRDFLKNYVENCEQDYEKNQLNVDKLIEYIKSLFALAETTEGDFNFVKETHLKCRDLAKKALELNDRIYLTHKWCAITIGRIIEYLGMNEKIKASVEFKKHLDKAIELNKTDYYLLYMRGRWAYGICNLNWAEKYAVRLIYGDMPSCTMDNAYKDFLKVEELNSKNLKGNLLYLAKCCIHFNDKIKALKYLNDALILNSITPVEQLENQEIVALLGKYSNN